MSFVTIKTPEQRDLLALHRVRSRLVSQRTGVTNQIRGFLLARGITVRQGLAPLRQALPSTQGSSSDALSPRLVLLIADLMEDWRQQRTFLLPRLNVQPLKPSATDGSRRGI